MATYGLWRPLDPSWGAPFEVDGDRGLYTAPSAEHFEALLAREGRLHLDQQHRCPLCGCATVLTREHCPVPQGWGLFLRGCPNALCPGRRGLFETGQLYIRLDGSVGWMDRAAVEVAADDDQRRGIRRLLEWTQREERELYGQVRTVPPPGEDLLTWWGREMAAKFTQNAPVAQPRPPLLARLWAWTWSTVIGAGAIGLVLWIAAEALVPGGWRAVVAGARDLIPWVVTRSTWLHGWAARLLGHGTLARVPAYGAGAALGVLAVVAAAQVRRRRWRHAVTVVAIAALWTLTAVRG